MKNKYEQIKPYSKSVIIKEKVNKPVVKKYKITIK